MNKDLASGGGAPPLRFQEHRETILIVDDDPGISKLLVSFFQNKGYKTLTAFNGKEALEIVERDRPAMVLLDVTMPVMDGISTMKKIREKNPQTAVVMITGMREEGVAQEAVSLGSYAYILKPFDLDYLDLVVSTGLVMEPSLSSVNFKKI